MIKIYAAFFKKLGEGFRFRFVALFFMSILSGLLEVLGITLIFPLISLISNPNVVLEGRFLRPAYDFLGFSDPKDMIYVVAGLIGFIYILKNIYMIVFNIYNLNTLQRWRNSLCNRLMVSYMRLPLSFHLTRASSDLITTLNSTIYFVVNSFMFTGVGLASNIIVMLMMLAFMLYNFFIPSLISATILILLTFFQVLVIRKYTAEINERITISRAQNLSVLSLAMSAIRETKMFQREKYFSDIYNESNYRISRYDSISMLMQYIPSYSSEIVLVITIIVMSCLVLSSVYTPVAGLASLAVLAAVAFRLAPLINRSLFAYSQMRTSTNAAQNLLEEFAMLKDIGLEALEQGVEPISFNKEISLKNVSYRYQNAPAPSLKNINCTIKKGEFIGIVGASGAGKTTLADLLLGLLTPEQGVLAVDDVPITSENVRSLRQIAGYVSQSPILFPTTLRENIAFGIDKVSIDDERVIKALEMASINDFFLNKELYLNEKLQENSKGLSGGQRQRIAIARALYNNPEILVLDEATSALDVKTESEITQVIRSLKGEKTIIAIAHRLSTLRDCDRVIYMDDGGILDIGTFIELDARHRNFSDILKLSSINMKS